MEAVLGKRACLGWSASMGNQKDNSSLAFPLDPGRCCGKWHKYQSLGPQNPCWMQVEGCSKQDPAGSLDPKEIQCWHSLLGWIYHWDSAFTLLLILQIFLLDEEIMNPRVTPKIMPDFFLLAPLQCRGAPPWLHPSGLLCHHFGHLPFIFSGSLLIFDAGEEQKPKSGKKPPKYRSSTCLKYWCELNLLKISLGQGARRWAHCFFAGT